MTVIAYEEAAGYLELHTVTDYQQIGGLSIVAAKEILENTFDVETAEQVAVITEGRGVQLCFRPDQSFYLLHHRSSSIVAVCRIEKLIYRAPVSAREIIQNYRAMRGI